VSDRLHKFEAVIRKAHQLTEARSEPAGGLHPFDERNVHPRIPQVVRDLFDDGHYAQATFEAYKFLDREVQRHSGLKGNGFKLMMQAFADSSPRIQLTPLSTDSDKDEQKGYQFLFAGSVLAVRNPRGHEFDVRDSPDKCLDHLGLVSLLLRRLEESGFR
jgi:uncharacterized protein (TIGR02391 family)